MEGLSQKFSNFYQTKRWKTTFFVELALLGSTVMLSTLYDY